MTVRRLPLAAAWLVFAVAAPAMAAPTEIERDTARSAMKAGDELEAQGRHEEALASFLQADAIMGVPTTTQAVARVLARLGRLREARAKAEASLAAPRANPEPPAFTAARAEAAALVSELERRIPALRVVVTPNVPGTRTSVDGVVVAPGPDGVRTPVDPGKHGIVVQAEGFVPANEVVSVGEGERRDVVITLRPTEKSQVQDPAYTTGPGILMGTGFGLAGVGGVVAAVTGGLAIARGNELDELCNPRTRRCPSSAADVIDDADRLATAANVAVIVAGSAAALGVAGVFWAVGQSPAPVDVGVYPTGFRVRVAF